MRRSAPTLRRRPERAGGYPGRCPILRLKAFPEIDESVSAPHQGIGLALVRVRQGLLRPVPTRPKRTAEPGPGLLVGLKLAPKARRMLVKDQDFKALRRSPARAGPTAREDQLNLPVVQRFAPQAGVMLRAFEPSLPFWPTASFGPLVSRQAGEQGNAMRSQGSLRTKKLASARVKKARKAKARKAIVRDALRPR
jgi:hypothetical protein